MKGAFFGSSPLAGDGHSSDGASRYGLLTRQPATTPKIRLKPRFVSEPPDFLSAVRQEGVGEKYASGEPILS